VAKLQNFPPMNMKTEKQKKKFFHAYYKFSLGDTFVVFGLRAIREMKKKKKYFNKHSHRFIFASWVSLNFIFIV
jgi:hypothetical protein